MIARSKNLKNSGEMIHSQIVEYTCELPINSMLRFELEEHMIPDILVKITNNCLKKDSADNFYFTGGVLGVRVNDSSSYSMTGETYSLSYDND